MVRLKASSHPTGRIDPNAQPQFPITLHDTTVAKALPPGGTTLFPGPHASLRPKASSRAIQSSDPRYYCSWRITLQ
jgi:hypothetical protein